MGKAAKTFARERDPRVFAEGLAEPKKFKRALGLDFGTNCGVAIADYSPAGGETVRVHDLTVGQWLLDVSPFETGPLRFLRLKDFLCRTKPDVIFCEDVKFVGGSEQFAGMTQTQVIARVASTAELIGQFKMTVGVWAEANGIPFAGFGIGMIKKFATGKGNANKTDMIKAANARFGLSLEAMEYKNGEDNMADAAFVLAMGLNDYGAGL